MNIRSRYDFTSESDAYKRKKRKNKKTQKEETECDNIGGCTKWIDDHRNTSSGVLTAMCLKHKLHIGYSILTRPESVDNYFSFIQMWYPDGEAPSDIICDNPCNLAPYCMNREPESYQNTQIHSDIFHGWTGHVCGPLFCARYWKQHSFDHHGLIRR